MSCVYETVLSRSWIFPASRAVWYGFLSEICVSQRFTLYRRWEGRGCRVSCVRDETVVSGSRFFLRAELCVRVRDGFYVMVEILPAIRAVTYF